MFVIMLDSECFNGKYRVKTVRADWIDYNNGDFFVTICTKNRSHYFGHIDNGEIYLTSIGLYTLEAIQNIQKHNPYCEVLGFVIMPNHIHLILSITDIREMHKNKVAPTQVETQYIASLQFQSQMRIISKQRSLLARTIANFKSAVTRYASAQKIEFGWQSRYHDAFIRNQAMMNQIADYVDNNVVRWATDCYF
jgi:REP element-mobilizing transposase RayT